MKRLVSLLLAVVLVVTLSPAVFAKEKENDAEADYLYCIGLFKGKDVDKYGNPDYALDEEFTRQEAVVMLIRLLGKEKEALAGTFKTPFTDVASWVSDYVGYAFENGITSGISDRQFGGEGKSTPAQFITLMLRALGYDDAAGDFKWNDPYALSDKIGLTVSSQLSSDEFTRGDAVKIAYSALSKCKKNTRRTLEQTLKMRGTIPGEAVIRIPAESVSVAVGETAWVWVMQSQRYDKVELWADWSDSNIAELKWEGKWYNKNCTGFYITGVAPGNANIVVSYSLGGSEKAQESIEIQVY